MASYGGFMKVILKSWLLYVSYVGHTAFSSQPDVIY